MKNSPAVTKRIRAAVFARADGKCEACTGPLFESGHLDHFFGRAKVPQSVANCWALCLRCDDDKTNNRPTAGHWLHHFVIHAGLHGHRAEMEMALTKLSTLHAKGRAA